MINNFFCIFQKKGIKMTGQRKIVVKPDEAAVIEELCSIIQTKAKVGGLFATVLITEGSGCLFCSG